VVDPASPVRACRLLRRVRPPFLPPPVDPVFRRRAELGVKLAFLALGTLLAVAFGLMVWRDRSWQPVGEPVAQPIPFSHKHHVGDDGIDCRYCHTTVERSAFAGLPSSGICLSCHSQLYTDQAVLQPLRESAASGRPIAWRRVHQLPDFVFFDHSVHVSKGVACVECHGRVDQMPLTWRVAPLQMQWCLACHRDPAPHLHPPQEVFSMRAAEPLPPQELQRLLRLMPLPDTRRLTDCSTCHR
jgi:hypothetical protein